MPEIRIIYPGRATQIPLGKAWYTSVALTNRMAVRATVLETGEMTDDRRRWAAEDLRSPPRGKFKLLPEKQKAVATALDGLVKVKDSV